MFQSSSSPKAGCNEPSLWNTLNVVQVSILIQPEGWMQWWEKLLGYILRLFQSSSSPKAGCNNSLKTEIVMTMFQSSSSPKAGCNALSLQSLTICFCFNPHPARRLDAILLSNSLLLPAWFQSSSSPKAGCNDHPSGKHPLAPRFNPHPARRLDAMHLRCFRDII